MSTPVPLRSLTRQTTIQVAVRIAIIVVIATVISYFHVYSGLQSQVLEQLGQYVKQRGVRESALFLLAQDNLRTFAQGYAARIENLDLKNPEPRFAELFEQRDDGSTRIRERFFHSHSITGVIGKHIGIDDDLRRRLVVGFDMLSRYGPAWQNRFANLYLTTPESAILVYWPGKPWGLNANSWEVNAKLALTAPDDDVVLVIDRSERAERVSTWSKLYFDYAVNSWMLSATEPVNRGGRNLVSVGHDMLLQELIDRTVNNPLEGTYNLIFREDGRLIAHPRLMDALRARSGDLSVRDTGEVNLMRIFDLVRSRFPSTAIIDNQEGQEYLAVARLHGPDWYLVTVFPEAIIARSAFKTARLILILGATVLLLEIVISFFVLRKQVAEPLNTLMAAANRVAAGDFDTHLNEGRPDEIGRLAQSFNTMSEEIREREAALSERGAKLAVVNEQLARELEERKKAENEIARQREALHQSEKLNALGSLLAGVAHELNNPLSVVVGRAILMESAASDPKTQANATKIREAAERCASIVKTFLAIARQQPPERSLVQVNALVETAADLIDYSLRTTDIELALKLDPKLPELSADAGQLTQVFTNLIVNAQQALAEVATPRRLTIETRFDRSINAVRLEFRDNGPGVPVEIRRRIFEPFYTSKPLGVGTGIGLSYSYGVVESHGGAITLESPAQGGACFIVVLPVNRAEESVPPKADKSAASRARSILVVDDEPEIAEMLGEILSREGHRVAIAGSGNDALKRLDNEDYDVILSDLKMPDLDGAGLYRRLQVSHPHLPQRMVFVTGDTLGLNSGHVPGLGDLPLIEKPFVPSEVVQAVNRILTQAETV